jgi:NAD(P)-dependent dehydrogenase (short-subunit alcohol dehydrogenase family)
MNRRQVLGSAAAVLTAGLVSARSARGARRAPMSGFNARSTAEDVTAGLDLSGRAIVVTGCNSGIGFETMRVLALRGAHVIGTGRTAAKAENACGRVEGRATPAVLELSDWDSVVSCARDIGQRVGAVDALICNAGVMGLPELEQVHGIEKQFAVNHLGHFILTLNLLDELKAAPAGRVVVVSSQVHVQAPEGGIQFDNLSGAAGYHPFQAYGHSKLANGLFALELARRLEGTTVTANALHPGVIKTNLARHMSAEVQAGDWDDRNIAQGAATSCYVAASPQLAGVSGYYFSDCNPATPSDHMLDEAMAARLWAVSEDLTRAYLPT